MLEATLSELVREATAGKLAVFLGAGASRPSGLPLASELIDQHLDVLRSRASKALPFWARWIPRFRDEVIPAVDPSWFRLEFFCRCLSDVRPEASHDPLSPLATGEPSRIHYQIASLMQGGLVRTVVTTNFDLLMERSLQNRNVPFEVVHSEDQLRKFDARSEVPTVLKIHGTMRPDGRPEPGIMADLDSIGRRYSAAREAAFRAVVENNSLLFLGYSGRDHMGAMSILQDSSIRGIFWILHSGGVIGSGVRRWLDNLDCASVTEADTSDFLDRLQQRAGVPTFDDDVLPLSASAVKATTTRLDAREALFALAHLAARNARQRESLSTARFRRVEKLIPSRQHPSLLVNLYFEWIRTLERRRPLSESVYSDALALLDRIDELSRQLPNKDELSRQAKLPNKQDIDLRSRIVRCDMQYTVAHGTYSDCSSFLPQTENLIDECEHVRTEASRANLLSMAWSLKSRIHRNSPPADLSAALAASDQAMEHLAVVGALERIYSLQVSSVELAVRLPDAPKAASYILAALRSALTIFDSDSSYYVQGCLHYAAEFLENSSMAPGHARLLAGLKSLGFSHEDAIQASERIRSGSLSG